MIIGLLGAHRTGKTTLAKAFAETHDIAYWSVSISDMQKKYGYDSSNQSYTWETRKIIQEHVLDEFEELLARLAESDTFILDRTPVDLIGYLVLGAGDNPTEEDLDYINSYSQRCIALTNKYFKRIVLVQPGIPLANDNDTSAVADIDVMNVLNGIYMTILIGGDLLIQSMVIPETLTDLSARIDLIT